MDYEFDLEKNEINKKKHGIDFEEAVRIISARKLTKNEKKRLEKLQF